MRSEESREARYISARRGFHGPPLEEASAGHQGPRCPKPLAPEWNSRLEALRVTGSTDPGSEPNSRWLIAPALSAFAPQKTAGCVHPQRGADARPSPRRFPAPEAPE